ncbi:hypothetical protein [Natrinema soli]|uniref:Uncharacterized protein n=1 Tax=Natrinema soli TaxID=1930624 RepID=A0ABD5SH37_9EURY|nr:hypothetical protein [Natrinema soli]
MADSWNRYAGDEFGAIWLDEPSHDEADLHDLLEMLGNKLNRTGYRAEAATKDFDEDIAEQRLEFADVLPDAPVV